MGELHHLLKNFNRMVRIDDDLLITAYKILDMLIKNNNDYKVSKNVEYEVHSWNYS